MIDVQVLGQQGVLRAHHVFIVVLREVCVQTVAGFARGAVPNGVRKDDVVARRIEELSLAEQHAGKSRREKTMARAASAVQEQHGIRYPAVFVATGLAQGREMQAQLRQCLARGEAKIGHHVVALERAQPRGEC
jgi:hypothetical protein